MGLRDIADWIGKAIPNEISKTNGLSKYTQYIPMVGPALSLAQKGLSAVDNAATAYGDEKENGGGNWGIAINGAMKGIQGQSASPGDYKTGYVNQSGRNFFDIFGQVLNYMPSYSSGDSGGSYGGGSSGGISSLLSSLMRSRNQGNQGSITMGNQGNLSPFMRGMY